jgi:hypothetical protein
MNKRNPSIIPGVVLILFGLWILLRQFDRLLPYEEKVFPFFLIAVSVFLLVEAVHRSRSAALFWSVFFFQVGIFFLLRNFGRIPYSGGEEYWPLFLFAFGLGFYLLFLFNAKSWGVLIPSGLLMYFGLTAAAHTFEEVPAAVEFAGGHFWPFFLLVTGVVLLIHTVREKL